MRSRIVTLPGALLLLGLLAAVAVTQVAGPGDHPLRVGAAISLREAMLELADLFEHQTGQPVQLTFGSSGQLAGQVRHGAAIDLLVLAAQEPMDGLARQGRIDPASRRTIAGNELVLVVPAGGEDAPGGFEDLRGAAVRRLAMGEPRSVAAGIYAQQVLEHLELAGPLRDRLVYGTNVRQVISYVERSEASAGIVFRTDTLTTAGRLRIAAAADPAWHEPIAYPAAIVLPTSRREQAEAFLAFLTTPQAQAILETHGFRLP